MPRAARLHTVAAPRSAHDPAASMTLALCRFATLAVLIFGVASPGLVGAQAPTPESVQARVQAQVPQVLASLKALVGIESGSRDLEGLAQLSTLVSQRLQSAGMVVQVLPTQAPGFHPQLKGA